MANLKQTIRILRQKLQDMGSSKVFALVLGAILLPILLEWMGLGVIAACLVGLYVIAAMLVLYATLV